LVAVSTEMEAPMLELCNLLVQVREVEKRAHPDAESKICNHFITGLQSHDLFSQRVQHGLKVIQDVINTGNSRPPSWVYKATWLGGALVEEARREYVRGFNEVSMGLTDLVQAERQGYLPEDSSEIARPMSQCLASIRGFGKRIRAVANILEALGTRAFSEVIEAGGETDVASSFSTLLGQYSFEDEKRTHHLVLNLPVPEQPELEPGEAILF
jgi:hypothetical protein